MRWYQLNSFKLRTYLCDVKLRANELVYSSDNVPLDIGTIGSRNGDMGFKRVTDALARARLWDILF